MKHFFNYFLSYNEFGWRVAKDCTAYSTREEAEAAAKRQHTFYYKYMKTVEE